MINTREILKQAEWDKELYQKLLQIELKSINEFKVMVTPANNKFNEMILKALSCFFIFLLTSCTKDPLPTQCTCIYEDGTKQPCETLSPPIPFAPPVDMICL
jgi:hypothetical protein